jgi:uncharacterized protein (TIGR01777 family)
VKITLTGASGFIGKPLIARLRADGHELHILGRRPVAGVPFSTWDPNAGEPPENSLAPADAVIHLAGEPVAQRWTPEVKKRIRDSRVVGTRNLVHALSTLSVRPRVLIAASAVGIYGSRGDEVLTERSPAGEGFLADVTAGWERESGMAEALGIRVVQLRIGMVLGKGGGALATMLPPFRAGVGGPIASGKQWMSWIHVDDVIGLIVWALQDEKVRGALNTTAPKPVRNQDFTSALGHVLHRPAVIPVPGFGLKLLYGEMASVILASQRVIPAKAQAGGYRFRYEEIVEALGQAAGA